MDIIARIHTDFSEKFGIPRQSSLIPELRGVITFEPEYRNPDAVRGIEGFSHIWLLFRFDNTERKNWSATVKPPRLGGNERRGVFATRSPFRPNNIGLSSVKLDRVEYDERQGPMLYVSGIDMLDNTGIYDIKPYIPYSDIHSDAIGGFADEHQDYKLRVEFSDELLNILPEDKRVAAVKILEQDPRPAYHDDPTHRYGVAFAGYDIRFVVRDGIAHVVEIQ